MVGKEDRSFMARTERDTASRLESFMNVLFVKQRTMLMRGIVELGACSRSEFELNFRRFRGRRRLERQSDLSGAGHQRQQCRSHASATGRGGV